MTKAENRFGVRCEPENNQHRQQNAATATRPSFAVSMKKSTIAILAGLTMVGPLAIDTYLPSFHAIGQDFGVNQLLVQQSLSAFLFAFALLMLFYGTLSDSFARRPVILWSLALYTAASLGAVFAPSFGLLLVCRVLQGVAAGGGTVVSRAIVQDRTSGAEAQSALAYMMMVFGLAPAIAPILGGWLHVAFAWRSVFLFLSAFGLFMFIACFRALPESLPRTERQRLHLGSIAANYGKVMRDGRFLMLALSIGIAFGGFALYIGSAANFIMQILHLPETAFGWLFIPLISGMMIGSALSARWASKFSASWMVNVGYLCMLAATTLSVAYNFWYQAQVPWAVLPLALYSFGLALMTPTVTVTALAIFPENKGLAASLQSFIQMLLFAVISGMVAPFLFDSGLTLAWGMLAGLMLSFLCWLVSKHLIRARGRVGHLVE